jgi:hypothetical protein
VRPLFLILLAGALSIIPAASAADSPELIMARSKVDRIRLLVDAGAVPHVELEKAERQLADAQDQAILDQALYGKAVDLTNDRALEMLHAAERGVARQQLRVDEQQKLADQGVLARNEVTPLEEELGRRQRALDLANQRVQLIEELSRISESEKQVVVEAEAEIENLPISEHYVGTKAFSTADFRRLNVAFQKKFGGKLPVSAMGMTPLHRSLGFDHRGRIDVALNPDGDEGRWLRTYLEQSNVSYFAFRGRVRRKATGAHIHIGPPSLPLRRVATRHPVKSSSRRTAD